MGDIARKISVFFLDTVYVSCAASLQYALCNWLLADVIRSRSLYIVARPSVRLSVCLQVIEIVVGNISMQLGTLAIH